MRASANTKSADLAKLPIHQQDKGVEMKAQTVKEREVGLEMNSEQCIYATIITAIVFALRWLYKQDFEVGFTIRHFQVRITSHPPAPQPPPSRAVSIAQAGTEAVAVAEPPRRQKANTKRTC
jgi:hypothetical protein